MISVLVRLRADSWDRFRAAHDRPDSVQRRRENGNLSHQVFNQLDDPTDIVFLDTWSSPQDSDDYYHSDRFQQDLAEAGAETIEIIKLEETDASSWGEGAV